MVAGKVQVELICFYLYSERLIKCLLVIQNSIFVFTSTMKM